MHWFVYNLLWSKLLEGSANICAGLFVIYYDPNSNVKASVLV